MQEKEPEIAHIFVYSQVQETGNVSLILVSIYEIRKIKSYSILFYLADRIECMKYNAVSRRNPSH